MHELSCSKKYTIQQTEHIKASVNLIYTVLNNIKIECGKTEIYQRDSAITSDVVATVRLR